jgi:hypothetical protein
MLERKELTLWRVIMALFRWNSICKYGVQYFVDLPSHRYRQDKCKTVLKLFEKVPRSKALLVDIPRVSNRKIESVTVYFTSRKTLETGTAGMFEPMAPQAKRYSVFVKIQDSSILMGTTGRRVGGENDVIRMAGTLHHEILHVWYVNYSHDPRRDSKVLPGIRFPTGHNDVTKGEIEPLFREIQWRFEVEAMWKLRQGR